MLTGKPPSQENDMKSYMVEKVKHETQITKDMNMKESPTFHMIRSACSQSVLRRLFRLLGRNCLSLLLLMITAAYVHAGGQIAWSWYDPEYDNTNTDTLECTPAVGDDGYIYMATKFRLYGFRPDGTQFANWPDGPFFGGQLSDHGSASSPAIGINGNIFIGGSDSAHRLAALYSFDIFGDLLWSQTQDATGNNTTGPDIFSTPSIGREGNIYFGTDDNGKIYSADWHTGDNLWSFQFTGGDPEIDSSMAVRMDGSVFYIGENNNFVTALTPSGSSGAGVPEWFAMVPSSIEDTIGGNALHFNSSPAVDLDGTIYVGGINGVYAIASNGQHKWTFTPPFDDPTTRIFFNSSPVIGPDGTVYIGASDGKLYAISISNCVASLKWSFYPTGWDTNKAQPVLSTPAVASNDIVYVTMPDQTITNTWLFAVNTGDGSPSWSLDLYPASPGLYVSSSPTIGADGTVYVADDRNLYAVTSSTSTPLGRPACSPWPMYQHDAKHTGNQNPLGMLAWWPAENNAIDLVGTHSGTLSSGVTYSTGEVGNCFNFNGSTGHVTVPASSDFDVSSSPGLTIEGWIDPTTSNTNGQAIVEWSDSTKYGVQFLVNQSAAGSLYANVRDTSGTDHSLSTSSGTVSTSSFSHVAMTYDGNGLSIYYNGTLISSRSIGGVTPETSKSLNIGCRAYPSLQNFFQGGIDELAVYNRALTGAEINTIYQNGSVRHMGKCSQSLDINW
jgi:outer membrane protein assembly factor BamB